MKKINFGILSFWIFAPASAFAHGHNEPPFQLSDIEWGIKGVTNISNIHPLIVHFPIALFMVSALFYILGALFKKEGFLSSGKWTLWLGTLGTGAAVWAGLQAANVVKHDEISHQIMLGHQYLGYVVLGFGVLLSFWLAFAKTHLPQPKILFLAGIIALNLILVQQADMGGRLVYSNGVGVNAGEPSGSKMEEEMQEHARSMASNNISNPVEILSSIKKQEAQLQKVITSGQLDNVHELAFSIRDDTKEFLGSRQNSSPTQLAEKTSLIDEISLSADHLDEFGDAGDKTKTEQEFIHFQELLKRIES